MPQLIRLCTEGELLHVVHNLAIRRSPRANSPEPDAEMVLMKEVRGLSSARRGGVQETARPQYRNCEKPVQAYRAAGRPTTADHAAEGTGQVS